MTPKLLPALLLSLSFAACEMESDLVQPAVAPQSGKLELRTDSCMEISTTHWLWGSATEQLIVEMAIQEAPEGSPLPKRFVIEATGDAMSEVLTRGLSSLNLVYHTGEHRLTGTLITQFYYGEVLELTFNDKAQVKYNGNSMDLRAEVLTAVLRTSTQSFTLSSGDITLTIPLQPGGEMKADLNTGTLLCIQ